jgi:hypothetical protein
MFDPAWREIGSLDVLRGNGARNESQGRKRHYRRDDHDVGTAAQATVARTILIGVVRCVARKNAGVGLNQVTGEDLSRGQKQHQERDNAPDCGPVRHEIPVS